MSGQGSRFSRRRLLQATGLATGSLFLPSLLGERKAYADSAIPKRLVIFITAHGPVTDAWRMRRPGLPADTADWEFPLNDPNSASFSETLRPLHELRNDLLVLDGLAMTSGYGPGFGGNGHASSTDNRLAAHGGGGGPSIDQVIAEATATAGSFKSLYYQNYECGCYSASPVFDIAGNQMLPSPAAGNTMQRAFDRLFGGLGSTSSSPSPLQFSRTRRQSTLDFVKGEYTKLAPKLGAEDRAKLTRHRDMIGDLEQQIARLGVLTCKKPSAPSTSLSHVDSTHYVFSTLYALAMACNLTQVAVLQGIQLDPGDIGAPSTIDVHQDAAHASQLDPQAKQWMTNYHSLHARQFGDLIRAFKSVPEGNGTMLDNSLLLWMPELGNGWHDMYRLMVVMAGGCGGKFRTGRYVHYAETEQMPKTGYNGISLGPAHSKLYVSIMQAFGLNRSSIGLTSTPAKDGSTINLTGPLRNLA